MQELKQNDMIDAAVENSDSQSSVELSRAEFLFRFFLRSFFALVSVCQ